MKSEQISYLYCAFDVFLLLLGVVAPFHSVEVAQLLFEFPVVVVVVVVVSLP